MDLFVSKVLPIFGAWDMGSFLDNSKNTLQTWGAAFVLLVGVFCLIACVVCIVKKLTAKQPGGMGKIIGFGAAAAAFLFGGWTLLSSIMEGTEQSIVDLGGGVIMPVLCAVIGC